MIDSVVPFFLSKILVGCALVYVSPSSTITRLLLTLVVGYLCLVSASSTFVAAIPGGVGSEYIIAFILYTSLILCLDNLSVPKSGSKTWAFNQLFSSRYAETRLPAFQSGDSAYVPTRRRLFFQRLWDVVWTGVIVWFFHTKPLDTLPVDYLSVPNGFLIRMVGGEVSDRELFIRIYSTVAGYALQYFPLRFFHSLATCIAMLCGQDPKDWPPLFGSISEAYTVRRWFGIFWHYLVRRAFTAHAMAVCTKVFRLPPRGQVTRSLVLVISFGFSAVMHTLCMPGLERCAAWPQFRYYATVIVIIALEDVVIEAYKRVRSMLRSKPTHKLAKPKKGAAARSYPEQERPSVLLRALGFAWVFCFHVWSTSILIYGLWSNCATR
ncbi:hypothetical protein ANO11243_090940 [Dothideomycetidae sp. 11243]|nr:hypothetical protein ANO11243_090940 [fungal sp. No.11243]